MSTGRVKNHWPALTRYRAERGGDATNTFASTRSRGERRRRTHCPAPESVEPPADNSVLHMQHGIVRGCRRPEHLRRL
jgi:hypothetical protein